MIVIDGDDYSEDGPKYLLQTADGWAIYCRIVTILKYGSKEHKHKFTSFQQKSLQNYVQCSAERYFATYLGNQLSDRSKGEFGMD